MADRDRRIGLNDPSIGPLPRTELLTELLIDERRNVLFVGEGDFSFTVAFAALRKSKRSTASVHSNIGTWDGIIATRYEPAGGKPAPVLSKVKRSCVMNCLNGHSAQTDPYIMDKLDASSIFATLNYVLHFSFYTGCHFRCTNFYLVIYSAAYSTLITPCTSSICTINVRENPWDSPLLR